MLFLPILALQSIVQTASVRRVSQESPILCVAAAEVGKGSAAGLAQRFAAAALEEAGSHNVSHSASLTCFKRWTIFGFDAIVSSLRFGVRTL